MDAPLVQDNAGHDGNDVVDIVVLTSTSGARTLVVRKHH